MRTGSDYERTPEQVAAHHARGIMELVDAYAQQCVKAKLDPRTAPAVGPARQAISKAIDNMVARLKVKLTQET